MEEARWGFFGKVVGATFSGLVAPVAVVFITQALQESSSAAPKLPRGAERVVVQGVGRTPQEALDSGLRSAVRIVAASLVKEGSVAGRVKALPEADLALAEAFVLRWEELGGSMAAGSDGETCKRELIVFVDRRALAAQLKAALAGTRHAAVLSR